jgi:NAD(P)-dependent dehydrogenase (short-subunit alcohol dehydrogenase family)
MSKDLFDLTGRVALVTGGSRGLGAETVRAFARAGADVMIVSRKLPACEALATEIVQETGRRAVPYACHVGRWAEIDTLVDAAYAEFGRVDILVNNAGMAPVYPSLPEVSEELWRKILEVNLGGPFRLTALIGTRMAMGEGGSIINVSSIGAERPVTDILPYAAAKAGLNTLTLGFARAFGPKVRVNAVVPGTFLTDIARDWDMEQFRGEAAAFALRRAGSPPEIAGAMLYLASDASSYTTGALLRVDGGYLEPPRGAGPVV